MTRIALYITSALVFFFVLFAGLLVFGLSAQAQEPVNEFQTSLETTAGTWVSATANNSDNGSQYFRMDCKAGFKTISIIPYLRNWSGETATYELMLDGVMVDSVSVGWGYHWVVFDGFSVNCPVNGEHDVQFILSGTSYDLRHYAVYTNSVSSDYVLRRITGGSPGVSINARVYYNLPISLSESSGGSSDIDMSSTTQAIQTLDANVSFLLLIILFFLSFLFLGFTFWPKSK